MEAMKMEHTVKASKDGVVKEIHGKIGEFVEHGKVILVME
jgi:biotin carboxyl carrier protein